MKLIKSVVVEYDQNTRIGIVQDREGQKFEVEFSDFRPIPRQRESVSFSEQPLVRVNGRNIDPHPGLKVGMVIVHGIGVNRRGNRAAKPWNIFSHYLKIAREIERLKRKRERRELAVAE